MSRSVVRAVARAVFAGLVGLFVLGFARSAAHAQGWHEDERFGFKLLAPRGWKPIPLKADENWLVAKFLCDEKDFWTDRNGGWTREHQPELMVIAFVAAAIENKKKVTEEEDEEGKNRKTIELTNPYKDYEDFLDRTYSGGGFFVSEREEGTSNGLPVTKLEIKVEKLAYTGPKRIVTWVFHAEGVDFAVQTELLEDAYPKRKSAVLSVLRSFKTIPRTMGPLPTESGGTGESIFISFGAMSKGSPEERKQKRLESELQIHARAKKSLPAGWQAQDHERFLVLYDTDRDFAAKLAASCAAVFAWAEENLGFIGQGEYVRRPVLRICANEDERDSLSRGARSGSGGWYFGSSNEIITCKDEYGVTGYRTEFLNRELLDAWMRDRDHQIWLGMPEWIQHGLYDYVGGARLSGRKLEFKDYYDAMQDFREAAQQGKNVPVRELVRMSQAQFYDMKNDWAGMWDRMAQADMLVRFLLSPEAKRSKQTKTLLFDYLKHVRDVVIELEAEGVKGGKEEKEPATEEEEEELYRKKHEDWGTSEREKQVLERVFQRAFAGWSDGDWSSFEKAFLRYAG